MGRKTRRAWAPFYLRGLLGPGERKSLQPMAARLGLPGHDQLQHFVASSAWDDGPLWTVLAQTADRLVGGPGGCLVIDDTALPKQGTRSVGVARQCCGQVGRRANCQSLVSRAGVPEAAMAPASKGEVALAELDRVQAAGARFGCVLADAGYGASAAFRRGLDARGLLWAVGIPKTQKVYATNVPLVPPSGRARKPVPDEGPRAAEDVLAALPWRRVTWRQGTKGALAARFAATRIRVADGPVWGNNRHLPGEEAWLVGEWRTSGERAYHLSSLPRRTSVRARGCDQGALGVRTGASSSKASWVSATSRAGPGRDCTGTP